MSVITAAVMLFLIMDPVGNLPIFLSILRPLPEGRRRKVMIRELLISLVVMLVFLFSGQELLNLLNLKQEAVSIAGGIVLFLIALRMIFPGEGGVTGLPEGEEPLIVPMAIPMIAWTVVSISDRRICTRPLLSLALVNTCSKRSSSTRSSVRDRPVAGVTTGRSAASAVRRRCSIRRAGGTVQRDSA